MTTTKAAPKKSAKITSKQQQAEPLVTTAAATNTHTQPDPRQTRARLRAWWARILEEINAVETEVKTPGSPLANALTPRTAHDLGLKLNQVWHTMATTMLLEPPEEFPEITPN